MTRTSSEPLRARASTAPAGSVSSPDEQAHETLSLEPREHQLQPLGGPGRGRPLFSAPPGFGRGRGEVETGAEVEFLPFFERQDEIGDGPGGVALHGTAAPVAGGDPDPGKEEAEVVVDLRDGAHRGAGVAGVVLLPDGQCRADAFDVIDVGPVDAVQELARVGRERRDVAALPLGVEGVEGQAALAASGDPGHHGQ